MNEIPAKRIMTDSQMSFKFVQPYREWGPNFKRRTFGKFDEFVETDKGDEEVFEFKDEKKSGRRRKRGCL